MTPAEITLPVTLAVLGAGFLHALWNAMLKSSAGEPLLDTALIVAGWIDRRARAAAVRRRCPPRVAWPFMAVSAVIHFAYYVTLAGAYRRGDLSFAYPLMRGVAPLIVTVLGVVFLGEHPTASTLAGIALISLGILVIAWYAGGRHTAAAAGWALANALIIAIYTLVDGAGHACLGQRRGLRLLAHLPRGAALPRVDLRHARPPGARLHAIALAARHRRRRARASPPTASRSGR